MSTTAIIAISAAIVIGLVAIACAISYCGDIIANAITQDSDDE